MTERNPDKLKRKLFEFVEGFPLFQMIGFQAIDFGPRFAKMKVSFRPDLCNANGVMHGGILATLIDASITQAMLMTDEYDAIRKSKGGMATVDLGVKYLRPVTRGEAICEANIVHLGKRVAHATVSVSTGEGKPVALGSATLMLTLGDAQPAEKNG
jgi:acyl-CoA thioesterase